MPSQLHVRHLKKFAFLIGSFLLFINAGAQTCGSTNLALSRPATGTAAASYENASTLVDGDVNTHFWPSDRSTDQWGYVQLASPIVICRAVVKWKEFHQGAFKVQVTNSNPSGGSVTWTDIAVVTSNNSPTVVNGTAINDLSIPNNYGSNQYVRLLLLAPLSNVQPVELEVYSAVTNQHPTVSITAPSNNATYTEGNTVTINATAADADGTVSKVEFYQGSTKLGEDLNSPYSFAWNNITTGNFALKAIATDNQGDTTHSAVVNITVNAAPAGGWSLLGNSGFTGTQFLGTTDAQPIIFKTTNIERARFDNNGVLLFGTNTVPSLSPSDPNLKVAVKGTLFAQKIKISQIGWADYVFDKSYKLPTLQEVEAYINQHHHLPGIPSAKEAVGDGLDIGTSQAALLQKIEELTLYVIELNKKIKTMETRLKKQKAKPARSKK